MIALFWDRLVAADPGFARFLLAARVTLSVGLSVLGLVLGAAALHAPVTIAVLGAIVAMQATLAVNDPDPRTTTLLVPLPGALGIALGAVFASRGVLADLVFLAVLFAAVAVRLRGPRWTAFGTIAMMTYFFALFLGAPIAELPVLIGAIVVTSGFTYCVRFVILPDRPAWIARRTTDAFTARIRFVAGAARTLVEARDPAAARRRLVAATQRLNETAASIEGRLGADAGDELRLIFDAELAAEELAVAAQELRDAGAALPRDVALALRALVGHRTKRAAALAARAAHASDVHPTARAVAAAIVDLGATIGRIQGTASLLAISEAPWSGGAGDQQPVMRQAVQVTLGSAVAIAVGEALSPQRWSWAVLATYFIFIGTASRGETLLRAWSRIGGTALGVAAGVLTGQLAAGHPLVDTIAIFACLFAGVYFLRISQTVMIFFITTDLALMYTLLGRFSDEVLALRLIETAVGAICGGLAATLILPTRTRDVVRSRAAEALDAAAIVVHTSIARLLDADTELSALAAAASFEERVQRFITGAKPAISGPALLGAGHKLRRWIVALNACSYYARMLARAVDRANALHDTQAAALLLRLDTSIARNIGAAAARIDGRHDEPSTSTLSIFRELHESPATNGPREEASATAIHLLERIDRTIARLARDEGTIVEAADAGGA